MPKTCPINWKIEDGPYPCPFKHGSDCSYNPTKFRYEIRKNCIPQHIERFNHDSREIAVPCSKCGKTCKTTVGEVDRDKKDCVVYRCYDCADEDFGWSLAAHIRGDC